MHEMYTNQPGPIDVELIACMRPTGHRATDLPDRRRHVQCRMSTSSSTGEELGAQTGPILYQPQGKEMLLLTK